MQSGEDDAVEYNVPFINAELMNMDMEKHPVSIGKMAANKEQRPVNAIHEFEESRRILGGDMPWPQWCIIRTLGE